MCSLSHSISQSSDSSSGCFVSSEVRGSGREGKRSSIVSLHGSPRAWVYGLGQNWSLQIQFLWLAQFFSVSFLSKRLHLAALVKKLPIFELWWAKFWLLCSSNLDCISKLLRQYCLTDFNNWNSYSHFDSMIFYISGILEMKGTLLCHAYAFYFFSIQRHLFPNIGTMVC